MDEKTDSSIYQIRVKGQLDRDWTSWFDDMRIEIESENITCLTGVIVDDAALHGILKKIRDMNLHLISVSMINKEEPIQKKEGNSN